MRQKQIFLIPIGVLLLLSLVFLAIFRRESHEVDTLDLVDDPYQAAKLLLRGQGFEVIDISSVDDIESDGMPVVLFALDLQEDSALVPSLESWRDDNYHLIRMHRFETTGLGVSASEPAKEFFFNRPFSELEMQYTSCIALNDTGEASFPDYPNLQLKLTGVNRFLKDETEVGFAIHVENGSTRRTLLADASFMRNKYLAEGDNAAYMVQLVTSLASHPTIYFLEAGPSSTPHLFALIWQKGKAVVLAFFACLLVFLWMRIPRLGPILPDPPQGRRSMREHIHGTAKFHWRMGHQVKLIEVVRNEVLERIRKLRPDWVGLDAAVLHRRLAEHAKLRDDQVALALGNATDSESFQPILVYLQTIRRSL